MGPGKKQQQGVLDSIKKGRSRLDDLGAEVDQIQKRPPPPKPAPPKPKK